MFQKWLLNTTEGESAAEVQLIDGRIRVPKGGWIGITAREAEHEDIVQCIRRQWVKVLDKEPTTEAEPALPKPKVTDPSNAAKGMQTEVAAADIPGKKKRA